MAIVVRCTFMDKHRNDRVGYEQASGLPIPVVGELYTVPLSDGPGYAHFRVLERERHYGIEKNDRLDYTIWVERI